MYMSFLDYAKICWTLAERHKQQRQLGPQSFSQQKFDTWWIFDVTLCLNINCIGSSSALATHRNASEGRMEQNIAASELTGVVAKRIRGPAQAAEMSFLRGGRTQVEEHTYLTLTLTSTPCQEEPAEEVWAFGQDGSLSSSWGGAPEGAPEADWGEFISPIQPWNALFSPRREEEVTEKTMVWTVLGNWSRTWLSCPSIINASRMTLIFTDAKKWAGWDLLHHLSDYSAVRFGRENSFLLCSLSQPTLSIPIGLVLRSPLSTPKTSC